jgi:hypothetical protein
MLPRLPHIQQIPGLKLWFTCRSLPTSSAAVRDCESVVERLKTRSRMSDHPVTHQLSFGEIPALSHARARANAAALTPCRNGVVEAGRYRCGVWCSVGAAAMAAWYFLFPPGAPAQYRVFSAGPEDRFATLYVDGALVVRIVVLFSCLGAATVVGFLSAAVRRTQARRRRARRTWISESCPVIVRAKRYPLPIGSGGHCNTNMPHLRPW